MKFLSQLFETSLIFSCNNVVFHHLSIQLSGSSLTNIFRTLTKSRSIGYLLLDISPKLPANHYLVGLQASLFIYDITASALKWPFTYRRKYFKNMKTKQTNNRNSKHSSTMNFNRNVSVKEFTVRHSLCPKGLAC